LIIGLFVGPPVSRAAISRAGDVSVVYQKVYSPPTLSQ